MSGIPLKRCSKCGVEKPATSEYFYSRTDYQGKLRSACIACTRAIGKDYDQRTPRNRRAQQMLYYHENREVYRERDRLRYLNNKQSELERNRLYHKRNKATISARHRSYRQSNPELIKSYYHNYRARRLSLPADLTASDIHFATDYWNNRCCICGRQFKDLFGEHTLAFDHWIPLSNPDSLGTVPHNMLPMCHGVGGCNNSKGAKDPLEWLTDKLGKRKAKQKLKEIEAYFDLVRREQVTFALAWVSGFIVL